MTDKYIFPQTIYFRVVVSAITLPMIFQPMMPNISITLVEHIPSSMYIDLHQLQMEQLWGAPSVSILMKGWVLFFTLTYNTGAWERSLDANFTIYSICTVPVFELWFFNILIEIFKLHFFIFGFTLRQSDYSWDILSPSSLREWNLTNVRQIAILGWETIKLRERFDSPSDICRKHQTCLMSIREDCLRLSSNNINVDIFHDTAPWKHLFKA